MKNKRKFICSYIFILCFGLIVFAVRSQLDWNISSALYDSKSVLGLLAGILAEVPLAVTVLLVYEPHIKVEQDSCELVNDFEEFKSRSNLIVANRITEEIFRDVSEKLYTRDIFHVE